MIRMYGDGAAYYDDIYIGDILRDVDGFAKWIPSLPNLHGYLDQELLLCIGSFLKELNTE